MEGRKGRQLGSSPTPATIISIYSGPLAAKSEFLSRGRSRPSTAASDVTSIVMARTQSLDQSGMVRIGP